MDVNITIIGAGVVGLAIARELSQWYSDVYVIEKHRTFGQETSSRNSEVIHSGIYYPTNSLKARLCVEGRMLLYEYCRQNNIPCQNIGKLIVATNDDEEMALKSLLIQAQKNGVDDVVLIDRQQIQAMEPHIYATMALYSPSTGIVDTYSLMKQLETDAIRNGAMMVYDNEVTNVQRQANGYRINVRKGNETFSFTSHVVINSAGLYSDAIARMLGAYDTSYELHYWKGEYFSVGNGKHKYISRLIYPVPMSNHVSLGIHATLNLQGRMRLGPNAIYLPGKHIDYTVDALHASDFLQSAQRILPFLEQDDLQPEQAAVRPKLQKPGDAVRDFVICNEANRGYPGFINLIGIESPGLTSCMAIAKYVRSIL